MTKPVDDKSSFSLDTHRIEALSDGIFAFAMTLLVMTLTIPDALSQSTNISLQTLLSGQVHKFINYFFSFLVLAVFWIVHHQQFHLIRRADFKLLWINIIILMLVALVPFSADIAGDFLGTVTAEVFFASNTMALGLLFLANWAYATRNHQLVDSIMDRKTIIRGFEQNGIITTISGIAIVLSFFIPAWSLWVYIITPFVMTLRPLGHQ